MRSRIDLERWLFSPRKYAGLPPLQRQLAACRNLCLETRSKKISANSSPPLGFMNEKDYNGYLLYLANVSGTY
jgi:hypothetical protein